MLLTFTKLSDTFIIGFILIAAVFIFGFWLWMLIDSIRYSKSYNNIPWVIIIAFFGFIGAVIYFFSARKKRIKEKVNPYEGIVEQD
jgi:cytochrome bd-type quinol oxidase subunit 2